MSKEIETPTLHVNGVYRTLHGDKVLDAICTSVVYGEQGRPNSGSLFSTTFGEILVTEGEISLAPFALIYKPTIVESDFFPGMTYKGPLAKSYIAAQTAEAAEAAQEAAEEAEVEAYLQAQAEKEAAEATEKAKSASLSTAAAKKATAHAKAKAIAAKKASANNHVS
tara:strand:- start:3443 stop:3943 length:501 start_codon:yes stop_codon:yes gene_type:complete